MAVTFSSVPAGARHWRRSGIGSLSKQWKDLPPTITGLGARLRPAPPCLIDRRSPTNSPLSYFALSRSIRK